MKKITLLGGAGYVGSHVTEFLLQRGLGVTVLDNYLYEQSSMEPFQGHRAFEFIKGSVLDPATLKQAIEGADAVVNFVEFGDSDVQRYNNVPLEAKAATTEEDEAPADEEPASDFREVFIKDVIAVCKKAGVKRFLHTSDCAIYGSTDLETGADEKQKVKPINDEHKLLLKLEQIVLRAGGKKLETAVMRLPVLFGHSLRMRFDLAVNRMAAIANSGELVVINGGDRWRPFLHVKDAARAIYRALVANGEFVNKEVFNVGYNDLNMQLGNLARYIKEAIPDARIKKELSASDAFNYKIRFDKIEKTLGFYPERGLGDGILEVASNLKGVDLTDQRFYNVR